MIGRIDQFLEKMLITGISLLSVGILFISVKTAIIVATSLSSVGTFAFISTLAVLLFSISVALFIILIVALEIREDRRQSSTL